MQVGSFHRVARPTVQGPDAHRLELHFARGDLLDHGRDELGLDAHLLVGRLLPVVLLNGATDGLARRPLAERAYAAVRAEQVGDAAPEAVELCQGVFPDGEEEAGGETFAANGLRELFEK